MLLKDSPITNLILELKSSKPNAPLRMDNLIPLTAREKGWMRLNQIIKQNKICLLTKAAST